jgi:hypothetical protein
MADNEHSGGRPALRRLLAAFCLPLAAAGSAIADTDLEAKVKAAYLYHLTKFVDWPVLPANEIRLCVVGSEPVGNMMGDLSNRPVRERSLKIDTDPGDPALCQVLFIGRGERRAAEILKRVRGGNVLTVSDAEDFARQGGIVGFYAESGKIKLEINADGARAANLRVSAKLLELARVVP